MRKRVQMLPKTVISSASNTYAKKRKRLGIRVLPSWAAQNGHLHILEYLVERKYDQYDECACANAAVLRPLGLFEVLTRNRQSAVGRLERIPRTQAQPDRMFTIPPRQQLSSTRWLAIRRRRVTHFINTYKQTKLFLTETHTYSTQKCSHY